MSAAISSALGRAFIALALILVAAGGAGLAVAADQPQTDERRPELTARSDLQFRGWRSRMAVPLDDADAGLSELSVVGRDILTNLYTQDLATLERSLGRGEDLADSVDAAREQLLELRLAQARELPDRRLGDMNRQILGGVDAITETLGGARGAWERMAAAASTVAELLHSFEEHDRLVFHATTAGRGGRWAEALGRLDEAERVLARAGAVRDRLAPAADVSTLDQLLLRYSAYDEALRALYSELAAGAAADSPEVAALEAAVQVAQQALPQDNSAVSVVVAEGLGPTVADALVVIERLRGTVAETLGDITEADEAGR